MSGWVRACGACGEIDIHSLYPTASMVDDAYWRCGSCYAGVLTAVHVSYEMEQR